MRGVNKVIIIGNLGADPDVKQFQNGGSVTSISVATSEQWNDKQTGERREQTEWHRISLYNKLGEIAAQYLRKGSSVYIEGSLRSRKYQDQNGQDRYITEIRADQMQMLGGNPSGQGAYTGASNLGNNTQQNNFANNGGFGGNYQNSPQGNYNSGNNQNNPNNFGGYSNLTNNQGASFDNNQFMGGNNQPPLSNQSTPNQPSQNPQISTPKAGAVDDDIPF